jgi:hypothetical protein
MLRTSLFVGTFRKLLIVLTAAALLLGTVTSFGIAMAGQDHAHYTIGHGHDHHHDHDSDEPLPSNMDTVPQDLGESHVHIFAALPPDVTLSLLSGRHVSRGARPSMIVRTGMRRLDRPPKAVRA